MEVTILENFQFWKLYFRKHGIKTFTGLLELEFGKSLVILKVDRILKVL